MATDLIKAFMNLSAEKAAIRQREQKLVSGLQEALVRLGYRLEAVDTNGSIHNGGAALEQRQRASTLKSLACSHCGRRFALPLHLGRHVSVMHNGKRASRPAEGDRATTSKKSVRLRRRMSPAARRAARRSRVRARQRA